MDMFDEPALISEEQRDPILLVRREMFKAIDKLSSLGYTFKFIPFREQISLSTKVERGHYAKLSR